MSTKGKENAHAWLQWYAIYLRDNLARTSLGYPSRTIEARMASGQTSGAMKSGSNVPNIVMRPEHRALAAVISSDKKFYKAFFWCYEYPVLMDIKSPSVAQLHEIFAAKHKISTATAKRIRTALLDAVDDALKSSDRKCA